MGFVVQSMLNLHIRPVTRTDLTAVYTIFGEARADRPAAEEAGFLLSQYTPDAFWDFLAVRQSYLAEQDGIAIGFVVIAPPTPDQMDPIRWSAAPIRGDENGQLLWLKMVAVLPTHKRQGVATALYKHLFVAHPEAAFITGLYEYPLNNRASAAFHFALGFQRVGLIQRTMKQGVPDEADLRIIGIYYRHP